ncbi:MAG: SMC-Scp complex subunit ScpB, partial [Pirellulales bacterium]
RGADGILGTMNAEQPEKRLGLDDFEAEPSDQGISLDQLSAAFAQMLRSGEDPYAPLAETTAEDSSVAAAAMQLVAAAAPDDNEPFDVTPRAILEAALFVGRPDNSPVTAAEVAALMRGVREDEIDDLVRELNDRYAFAACPYEIVSEGAGYRLVLRSDYRELRERVQGRLKEARLSQAAIDVLAIVAYNQPLTSSDVSRLRAKPSGAVLTQLVRRQLLEIERDPQTPASAKYRTTDRFLDLFSLSSLEDLPRQQDADPR